MNTPKLEPVVERSSAQDKPLTWKAIHSFSFECPSQFKILLAEEQFFVAEEVVRVLPQKRIVAIGVWRDKPVVAKLFFDPQDAKKHMEREVAGFKKLQENKVPTPPLLYYGQTSEKHLYILIFQRIFHANNLHDIWFSALPRNEINQKMQAVMIELATQHVLGIVQQDLHLKNFLLTKKKVFTLDIAQIDFLNLKLDKKASVDHLALLLSQLGVGKEKDQQALFDFYARARGWLIKPQDYVSLFLSIKKWQQIRARRLEQKIFRESSEFGCQKNLKQICMYRRGYGAIEFRTFLLNPELAFKHPTATLLKDGGSSTVVKIMLDDQVLVVKRYNLKNVWHYIRRAFRETRAASCWRIAQKLCLFGISTAKPVAFIEQRTLGLRGKSYYVTEYVKGEALNSRLASQDHDLIVRIGGLLRDLSKLTITHGDLKLSNILINENKFPVLIDLDGAKEHGSLSGLRRAWRNEVQRFLRNFDKNDTLREQFRVSLESD